MARREDQSKEQCRGKTASLKRRRDLHFRITLPIPSSTDDVNCSFAIVSKSQSVRPVLRRRASTSVASHENTSVVTTKVVTGRKSGDLDGRGALPNTIGMT